MGREEDGTLDCAHSMIPGVYEDWTRLLWSEMLRVEEDLKFFRHAGKENLAL